jgi:hypothetical protein
MDRGELVVIASFSTWMQAQFAQSMLESAGIESFLSNEFRLASGWQLTGTFADGMGLFVHAGDAEDATAILRDAASGEDEFPSL